MKIQLKGLRSLAMFGLCLAVVSCVSGQKNPAGQAASQQNVKSTPAYAEVLLKSTELTSELEALLVEYTDEFPRVKDIRMELEILKSETDRLIAVRPADISRLSLALGKLIVKKAEHAAALKRLQMTYQDSHPTVRKEKRQVEVFEAAIREILS